MLKLTQHDTKTAIYISAHALVTNGAIWKLQHIGRYTLSGTRPPRHGQV